MSPVIGQGIALSEKWPGIFVVAERGNDFETGAAKGGVGKDGTRRTGHLDAFSSQLSDVRARGYIHAYAFEYLRGRSCNTCVAPCMHVHAVCNARNRYSPIEIR